MIGKKIGKISRYLLLLTTIFVMIGPNIIAEISETSSAQVETAFHEGGDEGLEGLAYADIVPCMNEDGTRCDGAIGVAYIYDYWYQDCKLTLYYNDVITTIGPVPDGDAFVTFTKVPMYSWYSLWMWFEDPKTGDTSIFLEGDFKAKLWISGDFIDETDWVHLTKDSKGKAALSTLAYA